MKLLVSNSEILVEFKIKFLLKTTKQNTIKATNKTKKGMLSEIKLMILMVMITE